MAGTFSLPALWCSHLCRAPGAPSPASRSPTRAAVSVPPPGARNILMALAPGREPEMTLGVPGNGTKTTWLVITTLESNRECWEMSFKIFSLSYLGYIS